MGNFTNPQRIINKEFDAYTQSASANINSIAKTVGDMRNGIMKQKQYTEKLQQVDDQKDFNLRSSLNEMGTTGSAILDENILGFWNDKVDNYFQIKNAMSDGTLSRQEGNRALAQIEGLVPRFKSMVNVLATNSATFREDVANGNVSSVGSIENKSILNRIGKGGNVGIVERGGGLYFYAPEEDGEPQAMINGSELLAQANGDTPMYQTKPNLAEAETEIYNAVVKPEDINSDFVEPIQIVKGDLNPITGEPMNNLEEGKIYTYRTITKDNRPKAIESLVNSPAVATLTGNDGLMARVWQDEIPDGKKNEDGTWDDNNSIGAISERLNLDPELFKDGWHQYAEDMSEEDRTKLDTQQNQVMQQYLGNKIYNDNAVNDNTLKFVKKEVLNSEDKNPKTENPYYRDLMSRNIKFFENPIENASMLVNHTIKGQVVKDVLLEDGQIILQGEDYTIKEDTGKLDKDGQPIVEEKSVKKEIARFKQDDVEQQINLAQLLQGEIGGDNMNNNNVKELIRREYNDLAKARKLEMQETKKEASTPIGNFETPKQYQEFKELNPLIDEYKMLFEADKRLAAAKDKMDNTIAQNPVDYLRKSMAEQEFLQIEQEIYQEVLGQQKAKTLSNMK